MAHKQGRQVEKLRDKGNEWRWKVRNKITKSNNYLKSNNKKAMYL